MNIDLFDEKKLTQATVFFLLHSPKRHINILKLMKLLYLAERKSFEMFHVPIIGDILGSMKNGPVLSRTLDRINEGSRQKSYWDGYISDRKNHEIALQPNLTMLNEDDLLELSENDITALKSIWFEFGDRNQWELVDYTHSNCTEWRNTSSFIPITYSELFEALGFSKELSDSIVLDLKEQSYLAKSMKMINDKAARDD
ncbi:Panacea domain-containing protein [Neisseria dumasiana]|uniref:Panacea domain-containing protein n=1 Tax=Neisseria dumasiana TaxID=1931275 RepID=UPI000A18F0B4|nr:Panacea domain-containing protein [Neisseria dumasiana]OSI14206.1 hypothetical protein BV914_10745 [Neisseria dumasiana]